MARCMDCGSVIDFKYYDHSCGSSDDGFCDHCHERDCTVCHSENFAFYYPCNICGGVRGTDAKFRTCPLCRNLNHHYSDCIWCGNDPKTAESVKLLYPYREDQLKLDLRKAWISARLKNHGITIAQCLDCDWPCTNRKNFSAIQVCAKFCAHKNMIIKEWTDDDKCVCYTKTCPDCGFFDLGL